MQSDQYPKTRSSSPCDLELISSPLCLGFFIYIWNAGLAAMFYLSPGAEGSVDEMNSCQGQGIWEKLETLA